MRPREPVFLPCSRRPSKRRISSLGRSAAWAVPEACIEASAALGKSQGAEENVSSAVQRLAQGTSQRNKEIVMAGARTLPLLGNSRYETKRLHKHIGAMSIVGEENGHTKLGIFTNLAPGVE